MLVFGHRLACVTFVITALVTPLTRASHAEPVLTRSIAVWRVDALGVDTEMVARLESLFRTELERMAGTPPPSRRATARALRRHRRLLRCDGATRCLAQIGRLLGVDLVVSGSVAALGDSYVINLKVIDAARGDELRRIASAPLRGAPDELIEAVRVAAYELLAPDRMRGSIAVLADLVGAEVSIDGHRVGRTPLPGPVHDLTIGDHALRVVGAGYTPFTDTVRVRFQKTTRVVVRLIAAAATTPRSDVSTPPPAEPPPRWWRSTWFQVATGVAAIALGSYVGYRLGHDDVVDCGATPVRCR